VVLRTLAYADWIGVHCYLRPGQTFGLIFNKQLADIRSFPTCQCLSQGPPPWPGPGSADLRLVRCHQEIPAACLTWFDVNDKESSPLEDGHSRMVNQLPVSHARGLLSSTGLIRGIGSRRCTRCWRPS